MNSKNRELWLELQLTFAADEEALRRGGGAESVARQHARKRMTARERIRAAATTGSRRT